MERVALDFVVVVDTLVVDTVVAVGKTVIDMVVVEDLLWIWSRCDSCHLMIWYCK